MLFSLIIIAIAALLFFLLHKFRKPEDENSESQKALDRYLGESLSPVEIGKFYERYVGYLYEVDGHDVKYNGALNGVDDLGRDLIVKVDSEIQVIQTKCWSKTKSVHENEIFQLYGSMSHLKLSKADGRPVRAVFYTTARYSDTARDVARVLGVELRTEHLNRSYPMIKCNVSINGEKIYHLPFDPYYDKVKIKPHKGEFFALTVKEAVAKGFRRARNYKYAA